MVELVETRKLFHLTETKTYKQAFVAAQQVTIGESYNPFFGFYEGAREYPVLHEGQMIPNYWIAEKQEVGKACVAHQAHVTTNWERRFYRKDLPPEWENRWSLFERFRSLPPT